MRVRTLLVAGLVGAGMNSLSAQQSVPVDLRVTTRGLTSSDSMAVVQAVRDGLHDEPRIHIAYRPPRGSGPSAYIGQEFEVTRYHISVECRRDDGGSTIQVNVVDALAPAVVDTRSTNVPAGQSLSSAALDIAVDVARRITK
jgi:hypothetical protein